MGGLAGVLLGLIRLLWRSLTWVWAFLIGTRNGESSRQNYVVADLTVVIAPRT